MSGFWRRIPARFRSGGDLDSTAVAKPEVHAEDVVVLVNRYTTTFIVAKPTINDESWDASEVALAA